MYANFTEETCTGTGATLALAGATSGAIAFSESFADGDPVAYVLEDSGGTIKIAGIGNYVSATDDITRSDTWNWNGTAIDTNPSTNITLSGGTHTVRCDLVGEKAFGSVSDTATIMSGHSRYPDNVTSQPISGTAPIADRLVFYDAVFLSPVIVTNYVTQVTTLDAAATNTRRGIYTAKKDGTIGDLLDDSGNINVSTTGNKVTALSAPLKLPAGRYWFAFVTDSTVVRFRTGDYRYMSMQSAGAGDADAGRLEHPYQSSVTGALPSTVTYPTVSASTQVTPMGYS